MRYPFLKKAYDEAEGIPKVDTLEMEKDIMLTESWDYELKKKQSEIRMKKLKNLDIEDSDEENASENLRIKMEFIDKLKENQKAIDKSTSEFLTQAEINKKNFKETEIMNADGSIKNPKPIKEKVEWVERQECEELQETLKKNSSDWLEKVKGDMKEGEQILNLSPFSKKEESEGELADTGLYVLKDGKLVKGEGRKREEVMFSNWY